MANDKCQMANGAGWMKLTAEAVGRLLELRDGVQVTGARWESITRCLHVRVDGPGLPKVMEGGFPLFVDLDDAR